jgi:hypothetical protein
MTTRTRFGVLVPFLALFACAGAIAAAAQDDAPASWREAQTMLRDAVRDTVGRGEDPGRLSALGQALLRLGRWNDAEKVLGRVLAIQPADRPTLAGLGKMALYRHRPAEAESLLVAAGDAEGAPRDLYAARLRRGEWKGAAELAEAVGDEGNLPLLERLQEVNAFELLPGPETATVGFERSFPVPLVRVKLNGRQVLAAIDPGCPHVLVDPSAMRANRLERLPGERAVFWIGSHVAAGNALAQSIDLGGIALANVPVASTSLHRYSIDVNPMGRDIALVIGLPVLERMGLTMDFRRQRLELRRPGIAAKARGQRVPFERWTENQLVVWGTIGGGRRLSMIVGTGLPGAGFGGPNDLFDELGLRAGKMSNLMRGPGMVLQGRPWTQVGIPTLSLGGVVGDRVSGWMGAMDPGEAWREGVRLDGILGPEWFRGRRVTFDWEKHELLIESA